MSAPQRNFASCPAARTASMLAGYTKGRVTSAKSPCSRGMATVMAIVVIGLLASVLTATAARAVIEQRRAATTTSEAQASRLLAAAVQVARQQMSTGNPADGPIETPLGNVTLAWRDEGTARRCEVTIALGHVRQASTLSFTGDRLVRVE